MHNILILMSFMQWFSENLFKMKFSKRDQIRLRSQETWILDSAFLWLSLDGTEGGPWAFRIFYLCVSGEGWPRSAFSTGGPDRFYRICVTSAQWWESPFHFCSIFLTELRKEPGWGAGRYLIFLWCLLVSHFNKILDLDKEATVFTWFYTHRVYC